MNFRLKFACHSSPFRPALHLAATSATFSQYHSCTTHRRLHSQAPTRPWRLCPHPPCSGCRAWSPTRGSSCRRGEGPGGPRLTCSAALQLYPGFFQAVNARVAWDGSVPPKMHVLTPGSPAPPAKHLSSIHVYDGHDCCSGSVRLGHRFAFWGGIVATSNRIRSNYARLNLAH